MAFSKKTNHTFSPTKKQCQAFPRALLKSWFYLVTGCAILPDWNLIPGHRSNQPVGFFIKVNGERSNLFWMVRFTVIHPAKTKTWRSIYFPLDHMRSKVLCRRLKMSSFGESWAKNGKIWDDLWILGEFDHIKNDDNDTGTINNNNNRITIEIMSKSLSNGWNLEHISPAMSCFFCCCCSKRTHEISGRSADPHGSSSSDIVKADPVSSQSLRSEKPISLGERWSHLDHQPHA